MARRPFPAHPSALRTSAWLAALTLVQAASLSAQTANPRDVVARDRVNAGLPQAPASVDRRTPGAAWRSFLEAARGKSWATAAHLFDLSFLPAAEQPGQGASIAENLHAVLKVLGTRADAVTSEVPEGPALADRPMNSVIAARFERDGISGEIALRRVLERSTGESMWLFSRTTAAGAPFWYRVLVKGEPARGAEPINPGLGELPPGVRRATPRQTVAGFLEASQHGDFALAAHYLDLVATPVAGQRAEGSRLARRLMLTLLRTVWVDPARLSDAPEGAAEADVAESEEVFATVRVGHLDWRLRLAHQTDAELGDVWLISKDTVALIDRLYSARGYGWLGDHAPVALFAVQLAGLQLWQWLSLLLGFVVGWYVSRILGRWASRLVRRVARRTTTRWDDIAAVAMRGPAGLVIWALFLVLVMPFLGLTPEARLLALGACKLLAVTGAAWFLLRLTDGGAAHVRASARPEDQVRIGFLPILVRFAKITTVVIAVLVALDAVGVQVLGILAGLGIGGIAVAFAAQKTLENVFGTVAIAGDKPFKVGDWITVGPDSGTVEDIGFRSTRIRTLARTVVSIPNGVVVAGRIENFSERERVLFNVRIGVAYATAPEALRAVIAGISSRFAGHPGVYRDDIRVAFNAFLDSALQVEIWAWVLTTDVTEFRRVSEELNFEIIEAVRDAGATFAFPTRTIHLDAGALPTKATTGASPAAGSSRRSGG